MAFGGLGGIAGGIYIQAASLHPVGQYVAVSQNGRPSANAAENIFWRKNGPGETAPGIEDVDNGALQYLSIASIDEGSDLPTNFLEDCDTDGTDSEGTLTTERPSLTTVGMHSLPENFGRGSGRWRPGDEDYINVWFRLPLICQLVTGEILWPSVVTVTFIPNVAPAVVSDARSAFGNLRIFVANIGGVAIPASVAGFPDPPIMNLEFMHTIQR